MYFNTLDKKSCCGCTACLNSCPSKCITMESDEEGFLYPVIAREQCFHCGLCEKVCPVENPIYKHETRAVYAAYMKDENQRMQSTSGGVFYALAKWIIEQDGIVYGAVFDDKFRLKHIGVESFVGLQKLRGSKYLQSDLGNVFSEIKEYLKQGRWVYFTGVGCQVAGLHAFLRSEYATLVTSDLVCHGVPSQLMFDWHLDYLRHKEKGEITSYLFRDCKTWGGCETYSYVSQTSEKQKIRKLYTYSLSPYLYAFMEAFNYRYSCYDCKFARIPRQGDITLADYWGVGKKIPELDTSKGVSLVLVNSVQGLKLWKAIQSNVDYRVSCVADAALENRNLIHSTKMPEFRKICYALIRHRGYESVAKNEFRTPNYYRTKCKVYILHSIFGKLLRRIKHINN